MSNYIKQFLLNPKEIGAIKESSEGLAELITCMADLSNATNVVELGPGTSVFTRKILQKIPSTSNFFALETNPFFVSQTKKNCPEATVYHDSASKLQEYLRKHNMDSCDCIISGLPWAAFDEESQKEFLDSITNSLRPGGEFLSFSYLHSIFLPSARRFRSMLNEIFSFVKRTKVVWKNVPPAFVYYCIK